MTATSIRQSARTCLISAAAVAVLVCLLVCQSAAWGRGHFYVIGTGPAGPQTATLQALETMKQMDAIVASDQHAKLFTSYIDRKSVLFDPWSGLWDYRGKKTSELDEQEKAAFKVERFRLRDERVEQIKALLAQGKDVGLLDSGNPCLFGPSHWYVEHFDPRDVVIIRAWAATQPPWRPWAKARFHPTTPGL